MENCGVNVIHVHPVWYINRSYLVDIIYICFQEDPSFELIKKKKNSSGATKTEPVDWNVVWLLLTTLLLNTSDILYIFGVYIHIDLLAAYCSHYVSKTIF